MKDLAHYARAVDQAQDVGEARACMLELINQFDHKKKQQLFKQYVLMTADHKRLSKWAWDLVLAGYNEKVVKF